MRSMFFSKKQAVKLPAAGGVTASKDQVTTKRRGDAAEAMASDYLARQGLRLVHKNFSTPGRGGGEIDLVMSAPDGTLVFVEVRHRSGATHGGAGASITPAKQRRIVFAARHYLMRFSSLPPCRFDVVLVQGQAGVGDGVQVQWLQSAFDAS
jgi:putative endonuclease